MTAKERILEHFRSPFHQGAWYTHSQLAARTGMRHQAVFQVCRQLALEGVLLRERSGNEWFLCYGEPRRPLPQEEGKAVISFTWIRDEALQRVVRADWEEARRCLAQRCWKATILLSGACLEGVLVAALERQETQVQRLLSAETQKYGIRGAPLRELVRVVMKVVPISQRAAEFLIDSRNLIHAGVAAKESNLPTEADARAAFELLSDCIRRVTPQGAKT